MNASCFSCFCAARLTGILCAVAILTALPVSSHAQGADNDAAFLGPFRPSTALTIYVVNDAADTRAHITLRRVAPAMGDRVLLRAFDAEEKSTLWQYIEGGKMPDSFAAPRPTRGIPALKAPIAEAKKAGDIVWEGDVVVGGAGVHQIRVTAGLANTTLEVRLTRALPWGISAQNSEFKPWPQHPATLFALVPQQAEEVQIAGGPVRVSDETGAPIFQSDSAKAAPKKIAISQPNVVWKWEFPASGDISLRASGFPLILCPDEKSARAIGANLQTLPDGIIVAHQFQRRIAEVLPRLLDPKNVGRAEDLIVPLATREKEWLSDPIRNAYLLDSYGLMPAVEWGLRHQNVDPQSPWSGSLYGWQQLEKLPPPRNRWDRLKVTSELVDASLPDSSLNRLWGGASTNTGATAEDMALAVTLDAPFNPYFGKRELLYRAAASALRDLMALGEDETWRDVGADIDDYPGFMAFTVAQKTLPVYALVAPQMPADVRAVWTEGVEHIMDRLFAESLVATRNQSSHYLVAYQDLAQGSGLPRDQEMALWYAQRWEDGQHPSGFQGEQSGPDASYIGMTHWHEAVYFRASGDQTILESLRRSYRFFNYTVAPEPDGQMLGGFNFNHRVGEGFTNEQWGGARGILDDVLPEVGLWASTSTAGEQQQAVAKIKTALKQLPAPKMPNNITNPRYFYAAPADKSGVWPARESEDFVRDLGGELVAFKRANYYGTVYVGQPSPNKGYIASDAAKFRLPVPSDAENKGGTANIRNISPFLGGGLSFFWTPAYGSSVLATNWSPLAHQGLVAIQSDGKRYWEDYYATKSAVDEKAGTLTVEGRLENQPLSYVRTYRFEAAGVRVHVKLKADADVKLSGLWENLPFATGTVKTRGATLTVPGESNGVAQADRFEIRDKNGAGVEIIFDAPQQLRVQRNGLKYQGLQIARVEVGLPTEWKKGQEATLQYELHPS